MSQSDTLNWLAADSDEVKENLQHVGLVVWQSAFVLAEYLLRHPPYGQWQDVLAVDLGTGTGEHSWGLPVLQVITFVLHLDAILLLITLSKHELASGSSNCCKQHGLVAHRCCAECYSLMQHRRFA